MRLLLDTHIWLWSRLEPERLKATVVQELQNPASELWLSPLSIWELILLVERRRLSLEPNAGAWVSTAVAKLSYREAAVTHEVALEARLVNLAQRDPIDRLLAATARVYDLTLVTADERLMGVRGLRVLANR